MSKEQKRRAIKFLLIFALILVGTLLIGYAVEWIAANNPQSVSTIATHHASDVVFIATKSKIGVNLGFGSGFLVSEEGVVITNFHVIENAYSMDVKLPNGNTVNEIKVINADPAKDLAVIKLNSVNLPYAKLGNSDAVTVGERVVAIGNPAGLERTVTDGLISAFRNISADLKLIQISAPISSGSSGGPLFNLSGKVIGVTAAALDGAQNLNFAIPINYVKPLMNKSEGIPLSEFQESYQQKSLFSKPQQSLFGSDSNVNKYDLGDLGIIKDYMAFPYNIIIQGFNSVSPAKDAGLQVGDVIIGINGKETNNYEQWFEIWLQLYEGQKIKVKVLRNKQPKEFEVTLGKKLSCSYAGQIEDLLYRKQPVRIAIMTSDISLSSNLALGNDLKEEYYKKVRQDLIFEFQSRLINEFGHLNDFSVVDTGKLDLVIHQLEQQHGALEPEVRNNVLKAMGVTHLLEINFRTAMNERLRSDYSTGQLSREALKLEHIGELRLLDVETQTVLSANSVEQNTNSFGAKTTSFNDTDIDCRNNRLYVESLPPDKRDYLLKYIKSLETKHLNI